MEKLDGPIRYFFEIATIDVINIKVFQKTEYLIRFR